MSGPFETPGDQRAPQKKHPLNICIASPDFVGAGASADGTGMAWTTMAQALAAAGHQVTCLFLGAKTAPPAEWERWVAKYKQDGLALIILPSVNGSELIAPTHLIRSYEAYQWLKRNDRFDIIHFPDRKGPGYHTLTAKHHGIAFSRATICVGLHSMTSWLKVANEEPAAAAAEVDTEFMERRAVALADAVVSPSHSLLKWITDRHWEMPRPRQAQREALPQVPASGSPRDAARNNPVKELVYFGPFEAHRGVTLFCEALDSLPAAVAEKIHSVTFLGRSELIDGVRADEYLRKRGQQWRFPFRLLCHLDDKGTMDYLRQKDRLAVIPSLQKNSPYQVHECLAAGISFIASRIGGIPELIAPDDVSRVCFEPNVGALSMMLCAALIEGARPARPMLDNGAPPEKSTRAQSRPPVPSAVAAPDLTDAVVRAAVQALSIDPTNAVALKTLARIHLNAKCPDAAREACQLILKAHPGDLEALHMLEEVALQDGSDVSVAPLEKRNAAVSSAAFA